MSTALAGPGRGCDVLLADLVRRQVAPSRPPRREGEDRRRDHDEQDGEVGGFQRPVIAIGREAKPSLEEVHVGPRSLGTGKCAGRLAQEEYRQPGAISSSLKPRGPPPPGFSEQPG